jgi:hypothetical protein
MPNVCLSAILLEFIGCWLLVYGDC